MQITGVMVDAVEPALRGQPCLAEDVDRLKAGDVKTHRKKLIALLLLVGLLSISELVRTRAFFGPSSLTDRILRLNRIGEPIAEQTSAVRLVARPRIIDRQTFVAAVAPPAATPDILVSSLILSGTSNPFRSPPHID
jgi:hypothetical protein